MVGELQAPKVGYNPLRDPLSSS